MTLTIQFTADEEERLAQRASAAGKDLQTFVREAAIEKVDRPTISEILAPIHAQTLAMGISVEEIDAMADRARAEVHGIPKSDDAH